MEYIVVVVGNTVECTINVNYKAIVEVLVEVLIEVYFKVIAKRSTIFIRS